MAVNEAVLDDVPTELISEAETAIRQAVNQQLSKICDRIEAGESLSDEDKEALLNKSEEACQSFKSEPEEHKQEDTSSSERQQDSESNQPEN